jgi:hypothetical protein
MENRFLWHRKRKIQNGIMEVAMKVFIIDIVIQISYNADYG